MKPTGLSFQLLLLALLLASATVCVPPPKPPKDSLTQAIEERAKNPPPPPSSKPAPPPVRKKSAAVRPDPAPPAATNTDAIASVGTSQIPRDEFVALLIRSRGVPVLEQLIGLSAAEEFAKKRGVTVSDADVDFEYELALRRLSDPLAFSTTEGFDIAEAERLLDSILASRSMSRPEFMVTVRRNACLRRVLAAEFTITDEQLRSEYDLAFGDRIQLRHIQSGNLADASRIKERLAAGEDFADLATRYSTNATTARRGGQLDSISLRDEFFPQSMRQAAAKLGPGEVSDVIRVGEWYQIIKMERAVPAQQRDFDSVRDMLKKRIEVRVTDAGMRDLHDKLMRDAAVQISDPLLRDAYQAARARNRIETPTSTRP